MSKIVAEDAFRVLAKWSQDSAAVHVVMSRPTAKIGGAQAADAAILNQVLPHSQKALLTVRDENGKEVAVTVDLVGAKWEYAIAAGFGGSQQEGDGAVLPDFADITRANYLAATFPNGNRHVFSKRDVSG